MDQFPQMLYKAGGPEQIHGSSFSTLVVGDEKELAAALADGWHETTPAAKEAHEAAQAAALTSSQGHAGGSEKPPTREELEQKATELGIAFKPQTSDRKLFDLIKATLEA